MLQAREPSCETTTEPDNQNTPRAQMLVACRNTRTTRKPHQKERAASLVRTGPLLCMVGVAGFELATPCTPCKCATRLRYTPKQKIISAKQIERLPEGFANRLLRVRFIGRERQRLLRGRGSAWRRTGSLERR